MSNRRNSPPRQHRSRPTMEPLEARCLLSASVITELPLFGSIEGPSAMTHDNAGNIWYAKSSSSLIGQFNPATGAVTEYPAGNGDFTLPNSIAFGADGNLWVVESVAHVIAKIDTSGNLLAEYSTGDSYPISITAGPDGNLWYTEITGYNTDDSGYNSYYTAVAKITTDGDITVHNLSVTTANVGTIVAGPDGALWFNYVGVDQQTYHIDDTTGEWVADAPFRTDSAIGRITTDGDSTVFIIPQAQNSLESLTVDSSGNFWYTAYDPRFVNNSASEPTADVIGTFDYTPGDVYLSATQYNVPVVSGAYAVPAGITQGADGNIWFAEYGTSKMTRFNPATHVFDSFDTPTANAGPGPVLALGNYIYFGEETVAQLGVVDLAALDTGTTEDLVTTSRSISAIAGAEFAGTVAGFTTTLDSATALGLAVTINWGDGNTSAGVITATAAGYVVSGTNTYAATGNYDITVTISGAAINAAAINSSARVDAAFAVAGTSFGMAEQTASSAVVATFVGAPGSYEASIVWGDGSTSAGEIVEFEGGYAVLGTHAYALQGTYSVGVTVTNGTEGRTVQSVANVTDLPLTTSSYDLTALVNNLQIKGNIAYITDDAASKPAQYLVSINWGDGSKSLAKVQATGVPGYFNVIGSHTYKKHGTYVVTTTVDSVGPIQEAADSVYVTTFTVTV